MRQVTCRAFVLAFAGTACLGCAQQPRPAFAEPGARQSPQKLALVVGISKYARPSTAQGPPMWWDLHCHDDVGDMRQVLLDARFGFAPEDILVLEEPQATRQAILDAFERHLIGPARPGDVVVFYFAGHGQPIADDNGDEIDGLDESLVPFDYISRRASDGAKTNIRDDTLGELLHRLKGKMQGKGGKVEGNITVILDTCCSGTATRGEPTEGRLVVRGSGWDERLDGPRPRGNAGATPTGAGGMFHVGEAAAEGYVVLTATRNDQPAHQFHDDRGRPVGLFTHYLVGALADATPQTTYRALFERVSAEVGAIQRQDPQIEGEADQLLFAGTTRPVPPYALVRQVDGRTVTLAVGALHGASEGSRYVIYRAGSDLKRDEDRLGEVELTSVGGATSRGFVTKELRTGLKPEDWTSARAVETAHRYREDALKVLMPADAGLAAALAGLTVVTTDGVTKDNYDVRMYEPDGADSKKSLVVENKAGAVVRRLTERPPAPGEVREALLGEWRWQLLAGLRNPDPRRPLRVEIRLIPVDYDEKARTVRRDRTDLKPTDGGRMAYPVGTWVCLEWRNLGTLPVYGTVLHLGPEGSIDPVFPHPKVGAAEKNQIAADGCWHRLRVAFQIHAPRGRDLLKVIATREPVDFSGLLTRSRERSEPMAGIHGRGSPLARLLLTAETGTRGPGPVTVDPEFWDAAELVYETR